MGVFSHSMPARVRVSSYGVSKTLVEKCEEEACKTVNFQEAVPCLQVQFVGWLLGCYICLNQNDDNNSFDHTQHVCWYFNPQNHQRYLFRNCLDGEHIPGFA